MSGRADDRERIARERHYHDDRYEHDAARERTTKFYETARAGAKAFERFVDQVGSDETMLELGCGIGSAAFGVAERGGDAVSIDVSEVAIRSALEEAAARAMTGLRFAEMDAEQLAFRPASFDVVCGSGVLHHLDLDRAFAQIATALKPDGRACFYEPMGHNPLINAYRRLTPSLRTPDEHPLVMADFAAASRWFDRVEPHFYELTSLAAIPVRSMRFGQRSIARLERLDQQLFARSERFRRWSWIVVLELSGPRPPATDHP